MIRGYDIEFNAENTTVKDDSDFVVQGNSGQPGTGLGITVQPNSSGGDDVFVIYQTNGGNISEYKRPLEGGDWSSADISIPFMDT